MFLQCHSAQNNFLRHNEPDKNMSSHIWIKIDDDLHHIDALIT